MQTRTITEVLLYRLILNDMRFPKIEIKQLVAVSTSYEKLVEWYNSQIADDRWVDTIGGYNWSKTFKKDSPLEWYNPADSLQPIEPSVIRNSIGGGICEIWEYLEVLNKVLADPESADFIVIPE